MIQIPKIMQLNLQDDFVTLFNLVTLIALLM